MVARGAFRAHRSAAVALTVLVAVAVTLPVALALASGWLVTTLTSTSRPQLDDYRGPVIVLGVVLLLLMVISPAAQAGAELVGRRLGLALSDRILVALLRPAGIAHHEDDDTTQLVSTMQGGFGGSNARDAVVGLVTITIARAGATATALILFAYRWWVAVLLLAVYAFATYLVSSVYKRQLESAEGMPARLRRAMYLKDLMCTARAGKDVRVFGLHGWLLNRYRAEWSDALADTRRGRGGAVRASLLAAGAVSAGQAVTFVLLARYLLGDQLTVGDFTRYAVAATGLLGMMITSPDLPNIAAGGIMLAAVDELEERTEERTRPVAAIPGTTQPVPAGSPVIEFEHVGFRYPGSEAWVLRDLDLVIPANASSAIVGVNGAGKTTLVKLLCGLYEPTEGRILVDGVDLRRLDIRAWQQHCAGLFQDWVRWALPVRDNVLWGAPGAPADQAALDEVAAACGLDEVLAELPDGWDTVLSREFGGVDLSGGQWQRVGLARALWAARSGSWVLVLDEPTSALDVRGETELYERMSAAAAARTVVLISHRFSTVRHADQIVVLSNGTVVERGDHDSLILEGGRYAEMFQVQAQRFSEHGSSR